ncbi:MAG TPA: hypothetical protein VFI29_15115 [Hanamia sp.]|nr:hypothetical protein [Hanamia sp.]
MDNLIYKILWATIEDFVGLWEISWELNSLFPEKGIEENQETAKKVLDYFLRNNLVVFYFSKWGSDELTVINLDEAIKIINQKKYWEPPEVNDICVKIGNTKKGEKFYNEKLINNFAV